MRISIAADHGGFELKVQLTAALILATASLAGVRYVVDRRRMSYTYRLLNHYYL